MDFQDKKRMDFISSSIDRLYQDISFIDLALPERLKKVREVLQFASTVSESEMEVHSRVIETWNTEDRKDSPHHYDNRLD